MNRLFDRIRRLQPGRAASWTAAIAASAAAAAVLVIGGCAREEVEEPFTPSESHSAYAEGLAEMGMADTEMGRRWLRQAEQALANPAAVELPFQERGFFDPARPEAWGYRFTVEEGREVIVELSLPPAGEPNGSAGAEGAEGAEGAAGAEEPAGSEESAGPESTEGPEEAAASGGELKLFADIFRAEEDGGQEEVHHVASYSEERSEIRFETLREGSYILRLQPELLRGGPFTVSIRREPLLSFPVEGARMADIHSFFGDSRDGGRRRHEGVDIFAPRGTPILAVTEARVRRVGTRDLGGRIVLLWDEDRQLHYYYAHLETQIAEEGSRVEPGDVLGTVGNSGNARTTPPHLHFGVYKRWFDALDPWNFLEPTSEPVPEPALAGGQLDRWMVLVRDAEALRITGGGRRTSGQRNNGQGSGGQQSHGKSGGGQNGGAAEPPLTLAAGTPVRVVGAGAERVRALLPSGGGHGFIPPEALAPVSPAERAALERGGYLYPYPRTGAPAVARLEAGEELTVIGSWNGYRLVRLGDGRTGWTPSS
jgi:murein DD-endopeptidase MepM/ murein hydrolase activator NlpD